MKTSTKGLNLIKKYEGLRLTAYKPVKTEKYWTIGYGHYGADVSEGMTITKQKAEEYLKKDVQSSENAVTKIGKEFNQNQFDALVSFTYNCGSKNLKTLCNGRTVEEIGDAITLYNKAGGKVLSGLVKRRAEEQKLYKKAVSTKKTEEAESIQNGKEEPKVEEKKDDPFKVKVSINNLNIRKGPGKDYDKTGKFTGVGVFTIIEKKDGYGSKSGWGKLKSGLGWISLDFCEVVK